MGMGWSFDWRRTKVEPEPEELYTERINKSDARQPPPTVETDGIASVTTPISSMSSDVSNALVVEDLEEEEEEELTAYEKWLMHKQRRSSERRVSIAKEAGAFHRSCD